MALSILDLQKLKDEKQKITMVTCYDATFADLLQRAGIEMILVGDSLGMVIKGEANTLNVSVANVAYHIRSVINGNKHAHVVGDMPFLSHQISIPLALKHAGELLLAGAASVKIEGGEFVCATINALVNAGIPVMGHIGLLPQSVHAQGGFKVQGRDPASAERIFQDALAVEKAGAYAIVLEGIPKTLAKKITNALKIPTIGIGAGIHCDGQVLVLYDILGLNPNFSPKFVKKYIDGAQLFSDALSSYHTEVKNGDFPNDSHSFGVKKSKVSLKKSEKKATHTKNSYGPSD